MPRVILLLAVPVMIAPMLATAPASREPPPGPALQGTGQVDLVQVQLNAPRKVRIGKTFTVMDQVENQGEWEAQTTVTGFYLSTDDQFDEKDLLVAARRVPRLDVRQGQTGTTPITLKENVAPGDYHLIAVANARRDVEERYLTNNTRAVRLTVQPPGK